MKKRSWVWFIISVIWLVGCGDGGEQSVPRSEVSRLVESYEALIREREERHVNGVGRALQSLHFIEASRSHDAARRTSLALKLDDRITKNGDGIKAIVVELKEEAETELRPFVLTYFFEGEIRRDVTDTGRIPPEAIRGLESEVSSVTFSPGGDTKRIVRTTFYYSDAGLERRLRALRKRAGLPAE